MERVNGNAYPLFNDTKEQERHYNYFLARDLEAALRQKDDEERDAGETEDAE